jgi:hypothetical protein
MMSATQQMDVFQQPASEARLGAASGCTASGASIARGHRRADRKTVIAEINSNGLYLLKEAVFNNIGKPVDHEHPVAVILLSHADDQPGSSACIGLQKNTQRLNVPVSKKCLQLLSGFLGDFKHGIYLLYFL